MKKTTIIIIIALFNITASAQKYFTRSGRIVFFSKAPVENIEATNNEVSSILDTQKGDVVFIVLVKSFKFKKALMEEHFNENYMESATYPKAKFKGKIDNISSVNFSKDGVYNVNVTGQLEIHGVTKPITTQGTITVKGGSVSAKSNFSVLLADYGIVIPKLVADNISKSVDITVDVNYQPMPTE